ncbi:hypothetical protein F7731_08580 [Cytobacillus depressus]|uniref:Uncharacterized protein n=1 Tax=Cytobacillus depressus TaxID=1602942 RepID=A0A6L3VDR1_9BACI|nr:hypothetical protein [Cytobacillus depressus]KAB2337640.1 hypothetical protein F7731_08580 [Cytobacillus depressus]
MFNLYNKIFQVVILLVFIGLFISKAFQGNGFKLMNDMSVISLILAISIFFISIITSIYNSDLYDKTQEKYLNKWKLILVVFCIVVIPAYVLYRISNSIPQYIGDLCSIAALGLSFSNNFLVDIYKHFLSTEKRLQVKKRIAN